MNTHDIDIELPPLPPLYIAPSVEPVDYPKVAQALMDYARAAIEADRKRRGEPVHLFRRRGQPSGDFVTCSLERYAELSAMQDKFDTMIAYTAPQPAEPPQCTWANVHPDCAARMPAEPVKVPSDEEVLKIAIDSGLAFRDSTGEVLCAWREDADISEYLVENARALLARYGNTQQEQP